MDIVTKREREKETVSLMVRLYCRKKHHSKTLCPDCAECFFTTQSWPSAM